MKISGFQKSLHLSRDQENCAGNRFTQKPKISFSPPQRRLVAPLQVKFGATKAHVGPLGHTKFHANRFTGVGMRPQNIKNFHFLVKKSSLCEPLDRFLKFLRPFIAKLSYISVSNLT